MRITPSFYTTEEGGMFKDWNWGEVDLTIRTRRYHITPLGAVTEVNGQQVHSFIWYEIEALMIKRHRWDCINGQTD